MSGVRAGINLVAALAVVVGGGGGDQDVGKDSRQKLTELRNVRYYPL
jgi:hypothetical protein